VEPLLTACLWTWHFRIVAATPFRFGESECRLGIQLRSSVVSSKKSPALRRALVLGLWLIRR
jgi:hypothetical protein